MLLLRLLPAEKYITKSVQTDNFPQDPALSFPHETTSVSCKKLKIAFQSTYYRLETFFNGDKSTFLTAAISEASCSMGTRDASLGVMQLRHYVTHSPS
jgi:hypothetical protein